MALQNFLGRIIVVNPKAQTVKIALQSKLNRGDTIMIKNGGSELTYKVENIRIQGIDVNSGFIGDVIELDVKKPVEKESEVYKVI